MGAVFLTADLGTGGLRVGAIAGDGRVLAHAFLPTLDAAPRPGWAEADPETWWRAFRAGAATVLAKVQVKPAAICLTGMTRGQVFLDEAGRVLRPAILWADTRASALDVAIDNPGVAVGPFHALARIDWVARHEPAIFARTVRVLEPKDWLNLRLTGVAGADSVTAARFDPLPATAPHRALIDLPRAAPWEQIGEVASIAELEGVPVFAGAMDTWACAIGAGAVQAGQAYDVAGTTEQAGVLTPGRERAHGLIDLPWTPGTFQLGGPTQAGGDALAWACGLAAPQDDLAAALARAASADIASAPVFVPYLAGERAPVWRADARGLLAGLARGHGAAAILYAAIEGVAFALADLLAASGKRPAGVRISGGGARADFWCQVKADALGVPVERPADVESGLIGAAAACAIGLGHVSGFAATRDMNPVERVFEPDPAKAGLYAARRARYAQAKRFVLGEGA
jgi:xylulokinase